MRAGPDQEYPVVRPISRGMQVTVYGCLDDRSWCDVGYGRDRGWITGNDLATRYDGREEIIGNLSGSFSISTVTFSFGDYWENHYRQRPFYSERYRWEEYYHDRYRPNWGPRASRSYWGDRRINGYMVRRSWLRAGPDHDYPVLRRLAYGTQVSVYGCLRDWSWCDVSYQRDRGWVPGRDVASNYQGRRRSIGTIAPYLGVAIISFAFGSYWDNHYRDRSFYRERDRWERQYQQNYRPTWGSGPNEGRDRDQPRRIEPQQPQTQWQDRNLPSAQQQQPYAQQQPYITPQVQAPPPGHVHQPGQPAELPPGLEQGQEGQKPKPYVRKPKPGDPDYEYPGESGPNP